MPSSRIRLDPEIRKMLDEAGVPWTLDTGSRHFKVRVSGVLVLVVPADYRIAGGGRNALNARACVRRFLRSYMDVKA